MLKKIAFFMVVLGMVSGSYQAGALTRRPLTLAQTVALAERIVQVQCVAVDYADDPDSGHWVALITFKVLDTLKGEGVAVGDNFVVKQLADRGDEEAGRSFAGLGRYLPQYTVDKEYILFQGGDSELGLSAPIGFEDGVFQVTESGGQKVIGSLAHRGHLVQGLTTQAPSGVQFSTRDLDIAEDRPQAVEDFKALVRKLVR